MPDPQPPESQPDVSYRDRLLADFRRDGYIVIPGVFDPDRIAILHEALRRDYPGHMGVGELDDFVDVGDRRIFAPVRFAAPFDCADIAAQPLLTGLLAAILGHDFVFEAMGVITSRPGAADQHIHRDGGLLFPEIALDRVLPPSAVTVMTPLVDMDEVSGRTAFWPGSHRSTATDVDSEGAAPSIPVGALALWDYRVLHRGCANRGEVPRPLLYFVACRPHWIDHRNFAPGRNAKLLASRDALDALDADTRARFVRAEVAG